VATARVAAAAGSVAARAAALAVEEVRPRAAAMARGGGGFPRWLIDAAAERGLAGLLVPPAHGGAGASHLDFAAAVEAIARECASSSVVFDVHVSVATEPIVLFGTEEQRARFLPRLASGAMLGAFALSEPGSGSDAASLTTRADRVPGGWRLNGTKAWITNGGAADLYLVMARTGDAGARGISAFLVEADREGVRTERPLHKLGLRGSWTAGLALESVVVPEANLLHREGGGFAVAMCALDSGRIGISAQATGIAQGALDAAAAHLRARGIAVPDGAALIDDAAAAAQPAAAARLGGMAAKVAAARALYRHAARLCDDGVPFTRHAAIAKLVATDVAVEVAHEAVELCAPEAASEDHPAAIRLCDAKACQIYEGTNQVQRIVIARELLRG
jgi:alkylation response protein AidB-like acyl-CoA dehydrogenase